MSFTPLFMPRSAECAPSTACIRQFDSDFFVDEVLGFEPDGQGEHLLLQIEKQGCNTAWVIKQYAKQLGCRVSEIGYAGLKDRHAVTRQWLSLPVPIKATWQPPEIEGVQVLQQHRHGRKLRIGAHQANRFRLTLRDCQSADRPELEQSLERLASSVLPNYFGPQRFGRNGDNWRLAREWLLQSPRRKLKPSQRSLWYSSLRSGLFNALLAKRVQAGTLQRLAPADVVCLAGSSSVFCPTPHEHEAITARLQSAELHITGPLCGAPPSDERFVGAWQQETAWLAGHDEVLEALARTDLNHQRRALCLQVRDVEWQWLSNDCLVLSFCLNRGEFATSVLQALFDYREADRLSGG